MGSSGRTSASERDCACSRKWGTFEEPRGVIKVWLRSSRLTPSGYVTAPYTAKQIDLVAVYCGQLDRCYLLPSEIACERTSIELRVTPPLNGQRACINLSSDYEFRGAIAQLGERSAGSRKAGGSSPPSSTPSATDVGCHEFRNHFGYHLEQAAAGVEVRISRRGRPYALLRSA